MPHTNTHVGKCLAVEQVNVVYTIIQGGRGSGRDHPSRGVHRYALPPSLTARPYSDSAALYRRYMYMCWLSGIQTSYFYTPMSHTCTSKLQCHHLMLHVCAIPSRL